MFNSGKRRLAIIFGVVALSVWIALHIPAIRYGTQDLPLHQSYIGDEQSPINGALHILETKNLLGLRNLPTVYYGPVFSAIALPGIVVDFAQKYITGAIHSTVDYKNYILWDWGGILRNSRLLSVLVGFLGLWALYLLLMTDTVNPSKNRSLALIGVALLAFNFYFFEYTSFFRHWIYVITGLIAQIYFLVRMIEDREHLKKYYIWQGMLFVGTFGISYLSVLSQIIFLPVLIKWFKDKDKEMLKAFSIYVMCLVIPLVLVVLWHPRSFLRLINLTGGDLTGLGNGGWTSEPEVAGFSFLYYAQIIFYNHIALIGTWAILLFVAIKQRLHKQYIFWLPISLALIYYLAFALMGHHEARYILPVIVALIVSTSILFVMNFQRLLRPFKIVATLLLISSFLYHIISICFFEKAMIAGPIEKQAIAEALAYQGIHPDARQLFIEWYLLGYPHTKESYKDYADNYIYSRTKNPTGGDLYQAMLATPFPNNVIPLNVFEMHPDVASSSNDLIKSYDRVVYRHQPAIDNKLPPDFLEINLTRYWMRDAWSDTFTTIKE